MSRRSLLDDPAVPVEAYLHDLRALALSVAGLWILDSLGVAIRARKSLWQEEAERLVQAFGALFAAFTPLVFDGPGLVYILFLLVNFRLLEQGARDVHPSWERLRALVTGVQWNAAKEDLASLGNGPSRHVKGTLAFPLVLLPALLVCWSMDPDRVFALQGAFLILAVAEPVAWFVRAVRARRGRRAAGWVGHVAFGGVALVVIFCACLCFRAAGQIDASTGEMMAAAFVVAAFTTAVDALWDGEWKSLLLVLAATVLLVFFHEQTTDVRWRLVAAVPVGGAFAGVAYALRYLGRRGAVAGGLLAALVFGLGGWAWVGPSSAFFALSSLLSRVGRRKKRAAAAISEKGSIRDAAQVFANGGVGGMLLLLYALFPADVWYWGFLGAFAAASADTWATEVGTLSRREPRLLTTWRRVPRGTSGAVSAVGTLGALGGAFVVAASAWPFLVSTAGAMAALLGVVVAGVLASLVDSLAGATVQARYRDPRTGQETERPASAAGMHRRLRGWAWLRNDQVNGLCTFSGAALAMACFQVVDFAS